MSETTPPKDKKRIPTQPVSARRGAYFRNMRILFTVFAIGLGIYCAYDGYYAWPRHNQRVEAIAKLYEEARKDGVAALQRVDPKSSVIADLIYEPNGDLKSSLKENPDAVLKSIQNNTGLGAPKDSIGLILNQVLAIVAPIAGVLLLFRWLHISRGEYRLENDVFHAPGHPPVPLDAFTEIDDSLWDKKGIAYVDYKLADGTEGTVKFDDFIYERNGIDDMYELIEQAVDAKG